MNNANVRQDWISREFDRVRALIIARCPKNGERTKALQLLELAETFSRSASEVARVDYNGIGTGGPGCQG